MAQPSFPRVLRLLPLILLLAACSGERVTLVPTIDLGPTEAQYAPVQTTLPTVPLPGQDPCIYPAEDTICPAVIPDPAGAYPAGAPTQMAEGLLEQQPGGPTTDPSVATFRDCARTPGIVGCDPAALPMAASLAFYESVSGRLIFIDLASGAGAQAPVSSPPRAQEWSPDGQFLLVDLGADTYALYHAGLLSETFQSEVYPRWQPDGSLSRDGSIRSLEGWAAAARTQDGMTWELTVQDPAGQSTAYPLSGPSPDTLFSLRGWVPGQPVLLAQTYVAGNAAMLAGGQIAFIDAQTGALLPVDAYAPIDDAAFAWNPAAPQLAFLAGGAPEVGQGIGLLNFTGPQGTDVSYPLPRGVMVSDIAWRPDGQRLALAVVGITPDATDTARTAFPTPGIYLLDPAAGTVEPFVENRPGAQDGWLHWTSATGPIYARLVRGADGTTGVAQVRARQAETGQEWVLVDGLPVGAEDMIAGQVVWRRLVDIVTR